MDYFNSVKENNNEKKVMLRICKADEIVQYVSDMNLNVEVFNECEKPVIEVINVDEKRKYFAYHGVPILNELNPFLIALKRIMGYESIDLAPHEIEVVKRINGNLKMFLTPYCTVCPLVADLLYQIVVVADKLNLEIYDITINEEFKEKYKVYSVPKLVLNDKISIPGGFPREVIIKTLLVNSNK
ncbi:MAG: thioredoxin family protein [Sulfolobus sp.]|nr:thioredoxin family protein [Sulfolobus sp.]MBP1357424.1 thioredoxin family protein [Sulfolobus sp.]